MSTDRKWKRSIGMRVITRFVLAAMAVVSTCMCVQASTDITSPTGGVITYSASLGSYVGAKAFDNGFPLTTGSRWLALTSAFPDVFVAYEFTGGESHVVQSYKIWNQVQYSVDERAPKNFSLQGSSNGVEWVVLNVQSNQTGWTDGEARLYNFSNTVAYSHFKLNISTNNGDSLYTGFSELELFESAGVQTPGEAAVLYPPNNSTDQRVRRLLKWYEGSGTESNSVYFGTNAVISAADFKTNLQGVAYDPGLMDYSSTYYWRIDEVNANGTTTGAVWKFTTTAPLPEYVAYDGFEGYASGDLNGQGVVAADEWLIPWVAWTSSVHVVASPLFYQNGEVQVDGGTQAVALVNIDALNTLRRVFVKQDDKAVYFSALVQVNNQSQNLLSMGLQDQTLGGPGTDNSSGFDFAYPGGFINAEVYDVGIATPASVRVSTAVPVVSNETYFIVSRITRTGSDLHYGSSEVLVNPSTITEPSTGWTKATLTTMSSDVLDKINIRSHFMSEGEVYLIDEIRIGTTYASVVPAAPPAGETIIFIQ